jgi:HEAT repeat protein
VWALGKLMVQKRRELNYDELYHDAIDALIYALEDNDLSVQTDARTALRKIGDARGLKVLDRIEMDQGYCEF